MSGRLKRGGRLKALLRNQMLWTKFCRSLGYRVALVTSGAPVEVLLAQRFVPFYPENHAAICAARGLGERLSSATEGLGYGQDLCGYFRVDVGSQVTGESPLGFYPRPDLVVACNNICGTVQNWFRIVADRHGVPFFLLDAPFCEDRVAAHQVQYVAEQLLELAALCARLRGQEFSRRRFEKRLHKVLGRSSEALRLWGDILSMGKSVPAYFTSFEGFMHMLPIVTLRGTRRAIRYYESLLRGLEAAVKRQEPALPQERARVVWDNIAVWPAHRQLKRFFGEAGVALVADTYTSAWTVRDFALDDDPVVTSARLYSDIVLNHGPRHRALVLQRLIEEYSANGFILHSCRSCKRFSLGQYAILRRLSHATGAKGVVIEADMADPRAVDMGNMSQRLSAFFEVLGA